MQVFLYLSTQVPRFRFASDGIFGRGSRLPSPSRDRDGIGRRDLIWILETIALTRSFYATGKERQAWAMGSGFCLTKKAGFSKRVGTMRQSHPCFKSQ